MTITFQFQAKTALKHRRMIKSLIKAIAQENGVVVLELQVVFCDDDFLLEINKKYLEHDFLTDIITFDLSEVHGQVIGELYISVDTVRANSLSLNVSYEEELRRVMIHGFLHICGFADKTRKQQLIMRTKEDYYLAKYMALK